MTKIGPRRFLLADSLVLEEVIYTAQPQPQQQQQQQGQGYTDNISQLH